MLSEIVRPGDPAIGPITTTTDNNIDFSMEPNTNFDINKWNNAKDYNDKKPPEFNRPEKFEYGSKPVYHTSGKIDMNPTDVQSLINLGYVWTPKGWIKPGEKGPGEEYVQNSITGTVSLKSDPNKTFTQPRGTSKGWWETPEVQYTAAALGILAAGAGAYYLWKKWREKGSISEEDKNMAKKIDSEE